MSMLFKRIKDWATSITAFRTGDVIPVDGPSGTAKMSKDALLRVTAENVSEDIYEDSEINESISVVAGTSFDVTIYDKLVFAGDSVEVLVSGGGAVTMSYFALVDEDGNDLYHNGLISPKLVTISPNNTIKQIRIKAIGSNVITGGTLTIRIRHFSLAGKIDENKTNIEKLRKATFENDVVSTSVSAVVSTAINQVIYDGVLRENGSLSVVVESDTAEITLLAISVNNESDFLASFRVTAGSTTTRNISIPAGAQSIRVWTIGSNVTSSGTLSITATCKCLATQVDEGIVTKYDCPTPIVPPVIYTICNNLGGSNYAVKLYLEHFVNGLSRQLDLTFADGAKTIDCYAPINASANAINSVTPNTTSNRHTESISTTIGSLVTKTRKNVSFNHVSLLASNNASKVIRVLCIGDSVTEGIGAGNGSPYENNCPKQYWAWLKVFGELLKHQNSDSGFYVETLGDLVRNYFNLDFEGYQKSNVRTYSCGKGGSKTSDWLAPTLNDGSTNHFYDPVTQKFSLRYWVENYKTRIVGVDGTMTNCTEDTKGALAGSIEHTAVAEPTHVVIQLGYNQLYGSQGTTRTNYLANLQTMIETIATEYPDVKVLLSLPDTPCTYSPDDWFGLFSKDELYSLDATYGTAKAAHDNMAYMNLDLMELASDYSNVIYLPSFFVIPSLWAAQRRIIYGLPFLSANVSGSYAGKVQADANVFITQSGGLPYLHPGCAAHVCIGYELLATIFGEG